MTEIVLKMMEYVGYLLTSRIPTSYAFLLAEREDVTILTKIEENKNFFIYFVEVYLCDEKGIDLCDNFDESRC